jgi:hypothetical protein
MLQSRKSWLLILGGIALIALVASQARPIGVMETSARSIPEFDRIAFAASGKLILTQGDREDLRIVARPEDLANIVTEVRDGTLFIGWRDGHSGFSFRPPEFRLTVRTVAGLETNSSGSIEASNLRTDSLQVRISSSGGISITSLVAESLDVQITSSGSFNAAGTVAHQNVRLSSSGTYWAANLASQSATVVATSSGNATLRVTDSLQANISSSGNVRYYGSPAQVDARVTSSGRLEKLGN